MGEDSAYDMARRLFFVDRVSRGHAELRGEEARHLTRVLRVEAGQKYEISDNHELFLAEVETARKDLVGFRVLEKLAASDPLVPVTLLAALIKFDHFEWMLGKATELGVAAIVPVVAERSERGLEKAAAKRIQRWRRILVESSQQSRRAVLPELLDPTLFATALLMGSGQARDHRLFLDERGGTPLLNTIAMERNSSDHVRMLIGPEGGWVDHERERALAEGWTAVSLGGQVLRAETAALAALAVINAAWQAKTHERIK